MRFGITLLPEFEYQIIFHLITTDCEILMYIVMYMHAVG